MLPSVKCNGQQSPAQHILESEDDERYDNPERGFKWNFISFSKIDPKSKGQALGRLRERRKV